jgi:hypothetical protein
MCDGGDTELIYCNYFGSKCLFSLLNWITCVEGVTGVTYCHYFGCKSHFHFQSWITCIGGDTEVIYCQYFGCKCLFSLSELDHMCWRRHRGDLLSLFCF